MEIQMTVCVAPCSFCHAPLVVVNGRVQLDEDWRVSLWMTSGSGQNSMPMITVHTSVCDE